MNRLISSETNYCDRHLTYLKKHTVSQISIVIITKNEAHNIADCISAARCISDDIIVIDSGSTDNTILLAKKYGANVQSVIWQGYGHARNTGAELALHKHILSVDADERITKELAAEVGRADLSEKDLVYGFKRINYFGTKKIKFGGLAHDKVFRLYHKEHIYWNNAAVHETLTGKDLKRKMLPAAAIHYGIKDEAHYRNKKLNYARLCAVKYQEEGKQFSSILGLLSPAFNFTKAFIFQAGFLDLRYGFIIAKTNAWYTFKKYRHLQQLSQEATAKKESGFIKVSLQKIA